MTGTQPSGPIVNQLLFEFQPLQRPGAAPHMGHGQLAFAEINHEGRADRDIDQAFDHTAAAREIAHHRFVAVILVNQTDPAQHGAAIRAIAAGAIGLDYPIAAQQVFAHLVTGNRSGVNEALDLVDAKLAHGMQFIVRLDPFGRGVQARLAVR